MNTAIASLILAISVHFSINPNLVLAVARTESSLRPHVIGSVGEVGLFQIRPKYSNYERHELFNPVINTIEGIRMLKFAKRYCRHKEDYTWVICFNRGVSGGALVKEPKKDEYYLKVMKRLRK